LADALVDQYPDVFQVWSLRAYIYSLMRERNKAIDDLTQALAIQAQEPCLFFSRSILFIKIGDYQGAIFDCCQGLDLCDFYANDYYRSELHFIRAYAYLRLGNKSKALEDLQHVADGHVSWLDQLWSKEQLVEQCCL
jgi:tetratricopeptide (TPR) repeat protein